VEYSIWTLVLNRWLCICISFPFVTCSLKFQVSSTCFFSWGCQFCILEQDELDLFQCYDVSLDQLYCAVRKKKCIVPFLPFVLPDMLSRSKSLMTFNIWTDPQGENGLDSLFRNFWLPCICSLLTRFVLMYFVRETISYAPPYPRYLSNACCQYNDCFVVAAFTYMYFYHSQKVPNHHVSEYPT
jgi:membrane-bound acyltransferase YfiQ involved in biofilm formation